MAETDAAEQPFGSRRGWSLGTRIRSRDSYGLLLVLILCSLIVSSIDTADRDTIGAWLVALGQIMLLGGTLAFALYTSAAPRLAYVICVGLVLASVLLTALCGPQSRAGHAAVAGSALVLLVAVLVTIIQRFQAHPVVTGSSIFAAICAYLVVGLTFAAVYGFVAAADAGSLFTGVAGDGTNVERIYFSYVTLTTVGYGDFVMAANLGRMIAVTEALLGQVYLVTIVALLVSNIGARRRRAEGRDQGEHP
jgi:voltage-gated potassium channel Kch